MKYEDFVALVMNMRSAQKTYFKNRTRYSLEKAKELEREVDDVIAGINREQFEQMQLFPTEVA